MKALFLSLALLLLCSQICEAGNKEYIIAAIDKEAGTLTVKEARGNDFTTFNVRTASEITINNAPASLQQLVVGMRVSLALADRATVARIAAMGLQTDSPATPRPPVSRVPHSLLPATPPLQPPTSPSVGSVVAPSLTGQFYIGVDDGATVFLNGKPLMEAHFDRGSKFQKSGEVQVRVGDRLVFRLKNTIKTCFLLTAFCSSDQRTVISFPLAAYRLLPNTASTDCTDTAIPFDKLPPARLISVPSPDYFPFKQSSESVWGNANNCALGVIITPELLKGVGK